MERRKSPIITFYSYKGGVGRSMAVANVAWLLATKHGLRVLLVDWDLEAPGLHRFFDLAETNIRAGLIDMLYDYKGLLREGTGSLPDNIIELKKYITNVETTAGHIGILAAGRPDPGYANRVNEFNWEEFYSKWHGFAFIEYLKEQLRAQADIVIIDSRTGVTDIGGICTLQLPDAVVLLFALNEQNIAGAQSVAESIIQRATDVGKREKPPALILRPSRIDKQGEEGKKILFEEIAAKRLAIYLPTSSAEDALIFMKKKSIPYITSYSFGETPLAVQKDLYGDLAGAFDDMTESLLTFADVPPLDLAKIARHHRLRLLKHRAVSFLTSRWTTEAGLVLVLLAIVMFAYETYQDFRTQSRALDRALAALPDLRNQLEEATNKNNGLVLMLDRSRREGVVVEYFSKDGDPKEVADTLRHLGFVVTDKTAPLPEVPTNAIWFEDSVNLIDVKAVARALIAAKIEIKAIRPIDSPRKELPIIHVGGDPKIVNRRTLTLQEIEQAHVFTK